MNDMTSVIIPKSDQINADDLIAGPVTVTIRDVAIKGGQEQPVSIALVGQEKVYRPCKSMSRVLVAMWGPDAKRYVGKSMTLYRDPNVKWGGMAVGGIRISHMSDIPEAKTMALTETRAQRKPFTVKPLTDAPADNAATKWARAYIAKLATLTDAAAVDAFARERGAKLEELRAARPDLAAEVDTALNAARDRFDTFGGPADALTPASPNAEEGRALEDMGEGFTGGDDAFGGEPA